MCVCVASLKSQFISLFKKMASKTIVLWDCTVPGVVSGVVTFYLPKPTKSVQFYMPFMNAQPASEEFAMKIKRVVSGSMKTKYKCIEQYANHYANPDGVIFRKDSRDFEEVEIKFQLRHGIAFQTYKWRDSEWYTVSCPNAMAWCPVLKLGDKMDLSVILSKQKYNAYGPGPALSVEKLDSTGTIRTAFGESNRIAFFVSGTIMCYAVHTKGVPHLILNGGGPLFVCSRSFSASRSSDPIFKYLGMVYREYWNARPEIDPPGPCTIDTWIFRGYMLLKAAMCDPHTCQLDTWCNETDVAPILRHIPPLDVTIENHDRLVQWWVMAGFGMFGVKAKQAALTIHSFGMEPTIERMIRENIPLRSCVLFSMQSTLHGLSASELLDCPAKRTHMYQVCMSYNEDQHHVVVEFSSNSFRGLLRVEVTEIGDTQTVHYLNVTERKSKFFLPCAEIKAEGRGGRKKKQNGARDKAWKEFNKASAIADQVNQEAFAMQNATTYAKDISFRKFWDVTLHVRCVKIDSEQASLLIPTKADAPYEWYLESLDEVRFTAVTNISHLMISVLGLFEFSKKEKDRELANRVMYYLLALIAVSAIPVKVRSWIIEVYCTSVEDAKKGNQLTALMRQYYEGEQMCEACIIEAFLKFAFGKMKDGLNVRRYLMDIAWRSNTTPELYHLRPLVEKVIIDSKWGNEQDHEEELVDLFERSKEWLEENNAHEQFLKFQQDVRSPLLQRLGVVSKSSSFSQSIAAGASSSTSSPIMTSASPSLASVILSSVRSERSSASASSSSASSSSTSGALSAKRGRKPTIENKRGRPKKRIVGVKYMGITSRRLNGILEDPESMERGDYLENTISDNRTSPFVEPTAAFFDTLLQISPPQRALILYFIK